MGELNDFHTTNWRRMHEAFAPPHSKLALSLCIQEEIGELSAATLGVTKEKKRKEHLTTADVLDAVADAMTYVSLFISACGCQDLESLLQGRGGRTWLTLQEAVAYAAVAAGNTAQTYANADEGAMLFIRLIEVARVAGCDDWRKLLGDTFNMVSDRAGSTIRTTLGQQAAA